MASVIGVGDNTVDRYLHLGLMFPGGNAVNVPVAARRLGHPAAYIGWLGRDPHGMLIYNALLDEKVDITCTRLVEGENAFCEVTLQDGDRMFGDYSEGVRSQLALDGTDYEFISSFDLAHTSIYSFTDAYLPQLRQHAKHLSYDFSQDWDRGFLAKTLPYLDFALISNPVEDIEENRELIEFAAGHTEASILVTSGDKGAMLFAGRAFYRQPVLPVEKLVDTLGAGDAFAARFMVDYLDGISAQSALQNAAKTAAEACAFYGAFGHGAPLYKLPKS